MPSCYLPGLELTLVPKVGAPGADMMWLHQVETLRVAWTQLSRERKRSKTQFSSSHNRLGPRDPAENGPLC